MHVARVVVCCFLVLGDVYWDLRWLCLERSGGLGEAFVVRVLKRGKVTVPVYIRERIGKIVHGCLAVQRNC